MRAAGWWRLRERDEDCVPDGGEAWLGWRSEDSFSPSGLAEPAGLEECAGDHCHERVSVQASPRAGFEVIEARFFLELLMRLFADPTGLDGAGRLLEPGKLLERCIGRQVGQIVFAFAGRAVLADDP